MKALAAPTASEYYLHVFVYEACCFWPQIYLMLACSVTSGLSPGIEDREGDPHVVMTLLRTTAPVS